MRLTLIKSVNPPIEEKKLGVKDKKTIIVHAIDYFGTGSMKVMVGSDVISGSSSDKFVQLPQEPVVGPTELKIEIDGQPGASVLGVTVYYEEL